MTKPDVGLVEYEGSKHNNILGIGSETGGWCPGSVFLDEYAEQNQRYKTILHRFNEQQGAWWVYGGTSADGIHWNFLPDPLSPQNSDTQTACIAEEGKYRLYTRTWSGVLWTNPGKRMVGYTESDHFGGFPDPVNVFRPDDKDPNDMDFYSNAATKLKDNLYVMFPGGFYTKDQTIRCHLAWSRDGVHFTRYGLEPVINLRPEFDGGMLLVAPNAVPGDKPNTWWFYYFGTQRKHNQVLNENIAAGVKDICQ